MEDDWDLSAEELNFLEEDAIRKISERKASSSAASSSSHLTHQASAAASAANNSIPRHTGHLPSRSSLESRYNKAEAFPLEVSLTESSTESGKNTAFAMPKLSVSLFLHATGVIASKFSYHLLLIDAFHKIPRATWHVKERLWMFPPSSLPVAEEVLSSVTGADVEVHKLDPLVCRALSVASSVPDLRDLYDNMPSYIESKLLPFQREGVRHTTCWGMRCWRGKITVEESRNWRRHWNLGGGANPASDIVEEIWQVLAKAKYMDWENLSRERASRVHKLKEECERALMNFYDIEGSQVENGTEEIASKQLQLLDYLNEVFSKAELDDRPKKVPDYLCCQITLDIFRDPVITPSGITYERAVLLDHLQKVGKFDPLTREPLQQQQLMPNLAVKEAVQAFLNQQAGLTR